MPEQFLLNFCTVFIFLQEAVSSQLKSLEEQIDNLLMWLKETETQMQEETGADGLTLAENTRKQQLCKVKHQR